MLLTKHIPTPVKPEEISPGWMKHRDVFMRVD